MDIADRIKLMRGDQSREQFSEGTDTSAQTLYKYEKKTGKPTIEFVYQICKKFNICYAWLIDGEGPMHPEEPAPAPQKTAEQPVITTKTPDNCPQCAELKAELEEERRERRELSAENRKLWKENGELKEKCARFEGRENYQLLSPFAEDKTNSTLT